MAPFLVAFAVMSSGITSASTASRAFSVNALVLAGVEAAGALLAAVFILLVAAVNLRGVGRA